MTPYIYMVAEVLVMILYINYAYFVVDVLYPFPTHSYLTHPTFFSSESYGAVV